MRGAKFHNDDDYDYYYVSEQDLADTGLMFSTDGEHFTRLDALNRSSSNTRPLEKEELLDNIPLENRHFIDGCNITATAKVKHDDPTHTVKLTLHYTYSNVEIDPNKTNGQVKVDVDIDSTETSNFPFSADGMTEVLCQFNKAK
ncbi:MAG: hypothetical protein MJ200_05830 [Mycoplasmoidaceae bacterium]|nr:hypothetical protein [Mycoplasmoidaceae bacterium]